MLLLGFLLLLLLSVLLRFLLLLLLSIYLPYYLSIFLSLLSIYLPTPDENFLSKGLVLNDTLKHRHAVPTVFQALHKKAT